MILLSNNSKRGFCFVCKLGLIYLIFPNGLLLFVVFFSHLASVKGITDQWSKAEARAGNWGHWANCLHTEGADAGCKTEPCCHLGTVQKAAVEVFALKNSPSLRFWKASVLWYCFIAPASSACSGLHAPTAVPPIPQLGDRGSVSVPSRSASELVIFGK